MAYNNGNNNYKKPESRVYKGTTIEVRMRHGDSDDQKSRAFSHAMRKFKKMVQTEGIVQEYREKQFYVKPCEKRNRDKAAAKRRWAKRQREIEVERWGE